MTVGDTVRRLVAPLLLVAFAAAQETRPVAESGPATRGGELDRLVTELRRSSGVEQASLRASAIRGLANGSERLRTLLDEIALPEAAWRGIGASFVFAGDRTILPSFYANYRGGAGPRDRWIEEQLREFDRTAPIEDELIARMHDPTAKADVAATLRLFAEVSDLPEERISSADILIRALKDSPLAAYEAEVQATLERMTFHDFKSVDAWAEWLDGFRKSHPQGFDDVDLFQSALREKDRRFFREAQRGVERAIAASQPPVDWLDRNRYPESSIRRYAASRFPALRDAAPDVVAQAVNDLVARLADESDAETVALRLRAAGSLAEGRDKLRGVVAPEARARLGASDPALAVAALSALSQTGGRDDARLVEDLYRSTPSGESGLATREECITTLYSLGAGFGTIIAALGDPAWQVRGTAARILAYGRQVAAAPRLAQALDVETRPETQVAIVRALAQLGSWPDDVVNSLASVAVRQGPASELAARALLDAAGKDAVGVASAGKVVATLSEVLPALAPTSERRSTFLAGLPRSGGAVLADVLVGWLRLESDADAVRELASALARVAPSDVALLTREGVRLRKAGRNAAAATILRAALDAAASPSAAPGTLDSVATLREEFCRALLADGGAESLVEGVRQAQVLVSVRPDDWRLRLLRGEILQRSGRPADAAADWIAAIDAAGGALGDERRTWERRCLEALVDGGNPAAAKSFLDRLPPASDRDFLASAGRVEAAVGRRKEAASKYRNALRAPGSGDDGLIRFRLAEVLAESPLATDREEFLRILDVLESAPTTAIPGNLDGLRRAAGDDRRRAAVVAALDAAPLNDEDDARRAVVREGRAVATWLFAGLVEAHRRNAAVVVARRLESIRLVIPEFAAAFPPIPADANADVWNREIQAVAQWWTERPW